MCIYSTIGGLFDGCSDGGEAVVCHRTTLWPCVDQSAWEAKCPARDKPKRGESTSMPCWFPGSQRGWMSQTVTSVPILSQLVLSQPIQGRSYPEIQQYKKQVAS